MRYQPPGQVQAILRETAIQGFIPASGTRRAGERD
jgi:hypothetical protein